MLTVPYNLHILAEIAIGGLLNSLLAGVVIALVAWAMTHLFGRHGSGTRFAVWFSALVAIAILPWAGHLALVGTYSVGSAQPSAVTLSSSLASYLFAAWIVGAAFGLLRVGLSLYRLRQLRSSCTVIQPNQLSSELRTILAAGQARRRVTLCSSDAVRVPAAIGYFRPVVVFPTWMLQEIPASELEAILLHEMAHLRRWDDWTNLAQKIVKAVFFFHPAVWFIESRLSVEREMACDHAVLAANFSPRAYAGSLISLAEKSFLRRGVELAQAAVSHVQQLKVRIVEILRNDRQGGGCVWKPAVAVMAIAGIFGMYSVSSGPHLFAFSSDGMQLPSAVSNAGADSLPTAARFRPVNLGYVDQIQNPDLATHIAHTPRVRTTRRIAPTPHMAFLQRSAPQQFVEEEIVAPPMMVLSNFAPTQKAEVPVALLVVMQGEQFGVDGPVFWRLTIVHLTQSQQLAINGGIPKQI